MATKPLKSIKFPGLEDTYTVPQIDATLAVTGGAADAKATGDAIAAVAANVPHLLAWEDDFAGAAGYVRAGTSDTTVTVDGEGAPTITTNNSIKAYVAACEPGDRFMIQTRIPATNARPMLFLGAAADGARPILGRPTSSAALSLVVAPAGAEMVVFNANNQGAGLTYYIGADLTMVIPAASAAGTYALTVTADADGVHTFALTAAGT